MRGPFSPSLNHPLWTPRPGRGLCQQPRAAASLKFKTRSLKLLKLKNFYSMELVFWLTLFFYRDRRANLINSKFASLLFVVRVRRLSDWICFANINRSFTVEFFNGCLALRGFKRLQFGFTFAKIPRYNYPKTFTTTIKISLGKNLKQKNKLSNNAQFDLEF